MKKETKINIKIATLKRSLTRSSICLLLLGQIPYPIQDMFQNNNISQFYSARIQRDLSLCSKDQNRIRLLASLFLILSMNTSYKTFHDIHPPYSMIFHFPPWEHLQKQIIYFKRVFKRTSPSMWREKSKQKSIKWFEKHEPWYFGIL